ncbi:MAG TPA: UvrB/UvrC motif-containing protein, partial [Candidatus Paceibacterota bacterium]|nr:UvrB/UvrC motif-containing protein [Candidatus Paceibacterota bacterium]
TVHDLLTLDSKLYADDPKAFIADKRRQMEEAVESLDFETAAILRDEIYALEGTGEGKAKKGRPAAAKKPTGGRRRR